MPALLLVSALGSASAAALADREVLPNGVVLLVAPRPAIPVVVVNVYVRAGSAFDPDDASGLANLTGELLRRGTARRTGPALDRAIEFVGGSLEVEVGRDGALVGLDVLRKDLDLGLDLLSDVLLEPTFPEEELRRKVSEIEASIRRSEEDPTDVASRALRELVYPGHPYSRPVEGTAQSVVTLTRAQVAEFYRRHYRPDVTVIAVAGDVRLDEVRSEIGRRLGRWVRPVDPPAQVPMAPASPPVRSVRITRELTQSTAFLGRPGLRQSDPDYFALAVASQVLGGGSSSRLYLRVREERGLAYSVSSSLSPARHGSSLIVALQTRNDAVGQAVDLVRQELGRLGREAVPAAELEVARSFLIGSFPLRLDTTSKLARLLVGLEDLGLGLDYPDRYRERIRQVTAADVQRVAARYLDPAGFSSVIVGK
ncbi:MAG: insulinase family protein [Candidatus Rokubacteria bacterium]|nr:insulinase family protein [Candidatus Rokubacteria bacterium]